MGRSLDPAYASISSVTARVPSDMAVAETRARLRKTLDMSTLAHLNGVVAARAPARGRSRGGENVRAVFRGARGERSRATRTLARAGKEETGRTSAKKSNLIDYKPDPNAPAPWWPVDEKTGKPPGWFQLLVFAASQVFIGVVMQPAALLYQSAFEPFITKTP